MRINGLLESTELNSTELQAAHIIVVTTYNRNTYK